MKIKNLLFCICFFFVANTSFADSPLTSTDFHMGYIDIAIIKQARKSDGIITEKQLQFLTNSKNPIVIYKEDNGFVIKASEIITEVKVFDATGRYIKHQKVNAKSTHVLLPENQKGVLVFEVITPTNKYTKKALK